MAECCAALPSQTRHCAVHQRLPDAVKNRGLDRVFVSRLLF